MLPPPQPLNRAACARFRRWRLFANTTTFSTVETSCVRSFSTAENTTSSSTLENERKQLVLNSGQWRLVVTTTTTSSTHENEHMCSFWRVVAFSIPPSPLPPTKTSLYCSWFYLPPPLPCIPPSNAGICACVRR